MGFTMAKSCEYCQIDGGYGKLIKETPYWMIFLAPSQRYLGTCVVALKRQCQDLSELEDEEWEDFIGILQKLEHSLKKTFNPTLFNWSCFKIRPSEMETPIQRSTGISTPATRKKWSSVAWNLKTLISATSLKPTLIKSRMKSC